MEEDALNPPHDSHTPRQPQPSRIGMHTQPVQVVPNTSGLPAPLELFQRPPKRRLGGKFAYELENVKVAREHEVVSHPPHHQLTDDYERSFQGPSMRFPKNTRLMNRGKAFPFDGIPSVPAYVGFQDQVAHQQSLVRRTRESTSADQYSYPVFLEEARQRLTMPNLMALGCAPDLMALSNQTDTPQGGSSGLTRTVSWICPTAQARIPPANPDILHLLKLLRQQHRQEAELMSEEEAEVTWIHLSEEERYHVLEIYSKHTAQAQIAADEAAFMSVPTNRIVAQQNVAPSQAQSYHVASNSPQLPPFAHGLIHSGTGAPSAQYQQPSYEQFAAGGGGESSSHATPHVGVAPSLSRPSQASVAPSLSGAPQGPPPKSQSMHPDVQMSDTHEPSASNGVLSSHAMSQAPPQASPSIENRPIDIQAFGGMGDADGDPPLPFADDRFDISPELSSTPSRHKGKGRAVDIVGESSEPQVADGPRLSESPIHSNASPPPGPEAVDYMPDAMGPTPGFQGAGAPGDHSGYLTGGVIALLFNELRAINSNMRENSELQRQAIQAVLGFQSNHTQSTGATGSDPLPSSSQIPQTAQRRTRTPVQRIRDQKLTNPSLRARKRKKRVSAKVARWQGKDVDDVDDTDTDEEIVEDRHLTRLRARVRNLLQSMLGIEDWKHSSALFPALTDEQIKDFDKGELTCTAQEFFIDFDKSWMKFKPNRVAREVFLEHYFARVAGGAYLRNPTPDHLLTREVVGCVLDKHMPYCRRRWRESLKPLSKDQLDAIKARAAKNSRKRSIHFARSVIVRRHGNLLHVQLWLLLEPGNMDGDEPVGGEKKKFPAQFRIFRPKWASQEFCNYWWSLDAEYRLHYGNPTHERATRGNPPRDRVLPEGSVEDGIAPIGLWRNCYDKVWLDSLDSYLRRELEIVDEDFDLNLEPPPSSQPTSNS